MYIIIDSKKIWSYIMLKYLRKLIKEAMDVNLDNAVRDEFKELAKTGISTEQIIDKIASEWEIPKDLVVDMLNLKAYKKVK